MKRLILTRHGETTWNIEGKTQGIQDSHLTPRGRIQAEKLGKKLLREDIEVIYSSTLSRAKVTADIISKILNIPCLYEDNLSEMNFGQWEGLTIEEIWNQYPIEYTTWRNAPHKAMIPGGECLAGAQKRIVKCIEGILSRSIEKNILIISHNTVVRLYLLHILNMDLSNYYRLKQENCGMNIIEYRDYGPVLVKYNDTCYMDIMIEGV